MTTKNARIVMSTPCSAKGAAFEARPEGRFCTNCQETVHDLRGLTKSEAVRLFQAHGGRLCGRAQRSPSGEVLFRPERRAPTSGAVSAVVALTLAACDEPREPIETAPVPAIARGVEPAPLSPTPSLPAAAAAPTEPAIPEVPTSPDDPSASTDTSPHRADHETHSHRHAPVRGHEDDYDGGMTLEGL